MIGLLRWFSSAAKRRAARAQIAARTPWQKTCLERARGCLTLAQHADALAPFAADGQPTSPCETLSLLRAGCAWLLAWDAGGPHTWAELLAGARAAGRDGDESPASEFGEFGAFESVSEILARDFLKDATLAPDRVREDCAALRAWAARRRASCEAPERQIRHLRGLVWMRAALLASGLAVVAGTAYAMWPVPPDLAAGRPWKTSSTLEACDPFRVSCAGARTRILFHTKEDESPWMDIDLGDALVVHRVEVTNRFDCCRDRALPLVVELSEDDQTWTEVARKEDSFLRWAALFPAQRARFVRLRVARKSTLHLEAVSVR